MASHWSLFAAFDPKFLQKKAFQPDAAVLAASEGRLTGCAVPVESGPSGADTPGADGDNVNVDEEISTTADIAPPRPWRPRGVRAGRRLKKRYGKRKLDKQGETPDDLPGTMEGCKRTGSAWLEIMRQGTNDGSSHQQHDDMDIKQQPAMCLAYCKDEATTEQWPALRLPEQHQDRRIKPTQAHRNALLKSDSKHTAQPQFADSNKGKILAYQVGHGSRATGAPAGTTASATNPHGTHVPAAHGSAFVMRKSDHGNMQITDCQTEFKTTKQIPDLLAEVGGADSSYMQQCSNAVQTATSAAPSAQAATVRSCPATARDPDTSVRSPQATARTPCATAALSSATLQRTDPNAQTSACQLREDADSGCVRGACNTAVVAFPASATDMDDHFRRWQFIARQNQCTGFSAYPHLPCWAGQIAPYPGCEMKAGHRAVPD